MTREELAEASRVLESALEDVADEDVRERLRTQAEQLALLADREQAPDHGRLDRHQHALRRIKQDAAAIGADIDHANDRINAFRETIEGV